MTKDMLNKLAEGHSLGFAEAESFVDGIAGDKITDAQIAAFLVGLRIKGESVEELAGCISALRRHAVRVPHNQKTVFDCCGTGGDGCNTSNISTAAAIVVASCGVPTAKHGNRAVSSNCGSADILEEAGAKIDISPEHSARLLDEIGFCFLFAPHYHPATMRVAKVRRELGIRTIFNLIGPLLNPANATHQIIGTSSLKIAELLASVAGHFSKQKIVCFCNSLGVDEILPLGNNVAYRWSEGYARVESLIVPASIGDGFALDGIKGGDRKTNLIILKQVLAGVVSAHSRVTALNAALGFVCVGKVAGLEEGYQLAMDTLRSGSAGKLFDRYVAMSQEAS